MTAANPSAHLTSIRAERVETQLCDVLAVESAACVPSLEESGAGKLCLRVPRSSLGLLHLYAL